MKINLWKKVRIEKLIALEEGLRKTIESTNSTNSHEESNRYIDKNSCPFQPKAGTRVIRELNGFLTVIIHKICIF